MSQGEYLYFQTIVQFRVPLEGGSPEVLKKFTTEMKGKHPKKKEKRTLSTTKQGSKKI